MSDRDVCRRRDTRIPPKRHRRLRPKGNVLCQSVAFLRFAERMRRSRWRDSHRWWNGLELVVVGCDVWRCVIIVWWETLLWLWSLVVAIQWQETRMIRPVMAWPWLEVSCPRATRAFALLYLTWAIHLYQLSIIVSAMNVKPFDTTVLRVVHCNCTVKTQQHHAWCVIAVRWFLSDIRYQRWDVRRSGGRLSARRLKLWIYDSLTTETQDPAKRHLYGSPSSRSPTLHDWPWTNTFIRSISSCMHSGTIVS